MEYGKADGSAKSWVQNDATGSVNNFVLSLHTPYSFHRSTEIRSPTIRTSLSECEAPRTQ